MDRNELLYNLKNLFTDKKNFINVSKGFEILRSLNKTYPTEMNEICNIFWQEIDFYLDNSSPIIFKNAILFIFELIELSRSYKLNDIIINKVVYIVTKYCVKDKYILLENFRNCYENIIFNCVYDSTIIAIAMQIYNKNIKKADFSSYGMLKLITNLNDNFKFLNENTMIELFKCIDYCLFGKSNTLKNNAIKMCLIIINVVGFDSFQQFLVHLINNNILNNNSYNNFMNELNKYNSKGNNNMNRESIKDVKFRNKHSVIKQMFDNSNSGILNEESLYNNFDNNRKLKVLNEITQRNNIGYNSNNLDNKQNTNCDINNNNNNFMQNNYNNCYNNTNFNNNFNNNLNTYNNYNQNFNEHKENNYMNKFNNLN